MLFQIALHAQLRERASHVGYMCTTWLNWSHHERRWFIANYWPGYYLCVYLCVPRVYPFPSAALYCCGRAVDGEMAL